MVSSIFGSKLALLRRSRGLSQKELAQRLQSVGVDITNQAVSKWEKGATQPNATQFLAICRILDVDDIAAEFTGCSSGILRGLDNMGRKKVAEYADILRASGLFEEKTAGKRRILPLYSMAVSAGTGQFLDNSDYTDVEVGDEVPFSADFGVRVAGDSMEPRYHDGQTVWIHSQPVLNSGDTGVFLYDDNAYLKQLVNDGSGVRLRSFNRLYPDIEIRSFSQLRVLGKAVT